MKISDLKQYFSRYASSYFFRLAFLFVVYIIFGALTILLHNLSGVKGYVWSAGGVALASIFIWGYSVWPALFFATLVLQIINGDMAIPLGAQIVANITEPILTAYFCLRSPGFDNSLNRLQDIFRGFAAAIFSGFTGAVIGAIGLFLATKQNIDLFYFMRYWAGHSLGLIMITPIILVFSSSSFLKRFELKNLKKETIAFGLVFLSIMFLFTYFEEPVWLYLFFPLVLWSALRLGQHGALLTVFILSIVVIYKAAVAPSAVGNSANIASEEYLYTFVMTLQFTAMCVGAFNDEKEKERRIIEKQMSSAISEFEKKMLALKEAKETAETSSKAKTEFLANVGHEIRTPLAAVLGFSEILLTENMSAIEKKTCSDIIRRNGLQLTNVINDVLDLSKIQAGKFDIQKEATSMDEILNDLKSTMNPDAMKKGLALTFSSESNVPKKIFTDSLRLRQILINIISNAIKFTDRGSVSIQIKTVIDKNGNNKLAFIIKDTGVGIPEDKVKEVFLPFTQINISPTRRFGGTGLGLALSQKLAIALGGEIVLNKSILGQGSEFILTIDPGDAVQIANSEKILRELAEIQAKKLTSKKALSNKKILIVDDSPDNQSLLNYYVRSVGAIVDIAADGQEAIQKVHSNQYDIILMDIQMPVMDGYTATEVLRKEGYKKPIVALTAHAMKDVRDRCIKNGFDAYISKPIEKKKLIQALIEIPDSRI